MAVRKTEETGYTCLKAVICNRGIRHQETWCKTSLAQKDQASTGIKTCSKGGGGCVCVCVMQMTGEWWTDVAVWSSILNPAMTSERTACLIIPFVKITWLIKCGDFKGLGFKSLLMKEAFVHVTLTAFRFYKQTLVCLNHIDPGAHMTCFLPLLLTYCQGWRLLKFIISFDLLTTLPNKPGSRWFTTKGIHTVKNLSN